MSVRPLDPKRCCETALGSSYSHQCYRKGIVDRDGKLYCKQHDPVAVKARDEARREKWARESREMTADARKENRIHRLFPKLVALANLGSKLSVLCACQPEASGQYRQAYDALGLTEEDEKP